MNFDVVGRVLIQVKQPLFSDRGDASRRPCCCNPHCTACEQWMRETV